MPKPLKVKQGTPNKLCEFESGDTLEIQHGGTNATSASQALSNLGAASSTALSNHINDSSNPHGVTPLQIGAVPSTSLGQANGVCPLDSGSKIPASHLPAIAIPSYHVVTDAVARLALTVQEGDEATQLDDGSQWIYDGTQWHQRPKSGVIEMKDFNGLSLPAYFDPTLNKWLTVETYIYKFAEGNVNNNDYVQPTGQTGTSADGYRAPCDLRVQRVVVNIRRAYNSARPYNLYGSSSTPIGQLFITDPADDSQAYYLETPGFQIPAESLVRVKCEGAGPIQQGVLIQLYCKGETP